MKKVLVTCFLAICICFGMAPSYAITQQEADANNGLHYPKSIYNGGVNMTPQMNMQEIGVHPATGALNVHVTDVVLPGKNGFDLKISRTYNSQNAYLYEPYMEYTSHTDTVSGYAVKATKTVVLTYISNEKETISSTVFLSKDFCEKLQTTDFSDSTEVDELVEWMEDNTYEKGLNDPLSVDFLCGTSSEAATVVSSLVSTRTITETNVSAQYAKIETSYQATNYQQKSAEVLVQTGTEALLNDTTKERYSILGAGWEFDFPYIEARYGYEEDYYYLHLGTKGSWRIDFSKSSVTNRLEEYPLNDISVKKITGSNGERYQVIENGPDGYIEHYFDINGGLLYQEDEYGNRIEYECDTKFYEAVDGSDVECPHVVTIVDTMGRVISFTEEMDEEEELRCIYMTITNNQEEEKSFIYALEPLSDGKMGITGASGVEISNPEEWVLCLVSPPDRKPTLYSYNYEKNKFNFSNCNASFYEEYRTGEFVDDDDNDLIQSNAYVTEEYLDDFAGVYNVSALLYKIDEPNQNDRYFNYGGFVKKCAQAGSMTFHKVYSTYEGSTNKPIHKKTYVYNTDGYDDIYGEYDGYTGSIWDEEGALYSNYEVKEIDQSSAATTKPYVKYYYNYVGARNEIGSILPQEIRQIGDNHEIINTYTYASNRLLKRKTTTAYNLEDDTCTYTQRTDYTYDSTGCVLTEKPNNTADRVITYTYDSTYKVPTSKQYKQDANTTIREEYTLTSDKKAVQSAKIYSNNVLKAWKDYTYDTYGNVLTIKEYPNVQDGTTYVETIYSYQDDAYVSEQTVTYVVNGEITETHELFTQVYDDWGNIISYTDANENETEYTYDVMNRVLTVTNPDASTKTYSYDINKRKTTETNELGQKIETLYTLDGNVEKITNPDTGMLYQKNTYDNNGNLTETVIYKETANESDEQEIQCVEKYTYDSAYRCIKKQIYDASNHLQYEECYVYEIGDGYEKQTTIVSGDSSTPSLSTSTYTNNFGVVFKKEMAKATGNDIETYTYDYLGNVLTVKSPRAYAESWEDTDITQYTYDFMGNVVQVTNALGYTTRAEYDALGRVVKEYDANNNATEYTYDALGRVIEQTVPFEEKDGTVYDSVKRMWYDNNGNIIKERVYTHAAGETESYSETEYIYDNRNRPVKVKTTDADESVYTQYYYDAMGNPLRVYTGLSDPLQIHGLDNVTEGTDHDYAVARYTYDKIGNMLTATDALGQTITNTYDNATGLLLGKTDRNGQSFGYTYNALGNLTRSALSDGSMAETTAYNAIGQISSVQNSVTTISYTYNEQGLPVTETDITAGTVKTYTYDAHGNRLTFVLTRNNAVEISQSYTYDKLDRLTSVSENGTVMATYCYDKKNNRTKTTVTGGETTNYTYNLAGLPTGLTTGEKLTETYTYYLNGNQKSKTSNGTTTAYTYDGLGRLKTENNTTYTYDDFGNRKTMTANGITTQYNYDKNNRLLTETVQNSAGTQKTVYRYDPNGNQISKVKTTYTAEANGATGFSLSELNSETELFAYNAYGQMTDYYTEGTHASYTYAPDGLRHSKTVNGTVTNFVYDNANIIEEICGETSNKYYRGLEIIKDSANCYYIYNGHGDVVILTDNTGSIVADYTYDAFGNEEQVSTDTNPFRYCGEYTDQESGLVYLRARYYDSQTGRFISEDPAKDGLNWYVYCANNPVMFVDPSGLYYLEKDNNGQVYAVIEPGDTLSSISYSEVADANAYLKLNYAEPGFVEVGQRVNITEIYNDSYPIPTNIMLSKTEHTQGDSGLRDVSDDEVSRRARDRSLSSEERRRYQREEKIRGKRNKQKRQSHYSVQQSQLPDPNASFIIEPSQSVPEEDMSNLQFWAQVGTGVIVVVGVAVGIYYFCYTGDPSMIYQYAR